MEIERNLFKRVRSTWKLRELRDAGLAAIAEFKPNKFCIIESVALHFFEDCCLVIGRYQQGYLSAELNESLNRSFKVYSRDLKEWKKYEDQFEPKEGWHAAYEYEPHDAPFPTKQW